MIAAEVYVDVAAVVSATLIFSLGFATLVIQNVRQTKRFKNEMEPMNGGLRGALDKAVLESVRSHALLAARFTALSASLDMANYTMDAEGNLVDIDLNFQRLYGRDYRDLKAGGWVRGLSPEDQIKVAASGAVAMANHSTWEEEFDIHHADGSVRRVAAHGSPVFVDEHFIGFTGTMRVVR